MKYDARKLSTNEQALVRRIAVQRVFDGESAIEVARSLGLGERSVYPWVRKAKQQGLDALAPLPRAGRVKKLTDAQEAEVKRWVVGNDPRQYGFDFGLWTRQIVADLIKDRFGVDFTLPAVGQLLKRLGLTPQRPLRRAYERDDQAIKTWREVTYPKLRARAKRCNAEIFWLDEAAIRSDDPLLRTWGLKGQTPIVKTSGQRQKVNAISALSSSGGFWYHLYRERFNADVFIECLQDLIKNRKRPIFVIMDGHPVHRSKKVNAFVEQLGGRLEIHILPPYAPDLNPDELVWDYMRETGTARKPLKKGECLMERTMLDLELIKSDPALVKSFFRQPDVSFAAF